MHRTFCERAYLGKLTGLDKRHSLSLSNVRAPGVHHRDQAMHQATDHALITT